VLDETGGNRSETARRLGISRKTIDRKLAAWDGA
jgi:ActR/RegA family two-component response regulator